MHDYFTEKGKMMNKINSSDDTIRETHSDTNCSHTDVARRAYKLWQTHKIPVAKDDFNTWLQTEASLLDSPLLHEHKT